MLGMRKAPSIRILSGNHLGRERIAHQKVDGRLIGSEELERLSIFNSLILGKDFESGWRIEFRVDRNPQKLHVGDIF